MVSHRLLVEGERLAVEPLRPGAGIILKIEANPLESVELPRRVFSDVNDMRDP
jgi:hypothetical protein